VLTYVLPLRADRPRLDLSTYLAWLAERVEVIVVDGSSPEVFAQHHRSWSNVVRHITVEPARRTPMGKVGGVLTGLDHASHPFVVIADDDVRYNESDLFEMERRLGDAEVVRPQNVFTAWPWHAWWDTGRTLIARATGGDFPGTLGVRRDALDAIGGYDGDVMFENLELIRTVRAAGGREHVALDLVIGREPPTVAHFLRQRVRQAYDELARPAHLAVQLAVLPLVLVGGRRAAATIVTSSVVVAEIGRRRAGGRADYPTATVLAAPLWVAERSVTAWLAVAMRVLRGGVRYGDVRLRRAASSPRELRARHSRMGTRPGVPHASASRCPRDDGRDAWLGPSRLATEEATG
jgi:hypothetical protein